MRTTRQDDADTQNPEDMPAGTLADEAAKGRAEEVAAQAEAAKSRPEDRILDEAPQGGRFIVGGQMVDVNGEPITQD